MRRHLIWTALAVLVAFVVALGVTAAPDKATLVAKKVSAAPTIDGIVDDVWQSAPEMEVQLSGGRNLPDGKTQAKLRAVYTDDMSYLLLQYKDPTESLRRSPWVKQADGSWMKAGDPNDKGGDNNVAYEDKFAIAWNISSPAFEQKGCMSVCHVGEGKPFGNKYTATAGERLDLWHWKGVRTGYTGQADDQYVDNTRYDKDTAPVAGRKSDPKTGGGYVDNVSDDKKGPKFALPDNKPAPPYWIMDAEKQPFDDSKYKAGNEVPSIIVAPFTGDRGDISARFTYKDGVRTIEMARKRVTGSEYDVQFDDLKKTYMFGLAIFDNAQVRHAFHTSVLKMVFE